jgi:hypothetical protein
MYMRKSAVILTAALLAGAFRPLVMRACERSMPECARPAVTACPMAKGTCHKVAAAAKRDCPTTMACCIVQDDRASVAAFSLAPYFSDEGVVMSVVSIPAASSAVSFVSSPSPPGDTVSSQEGFLSSSSLRGPPILA